MKFFNQFKLTRLEQLGLIILFLFICIGSGSFVLSNWIRKSSPITLTPVDRLVIDSLLEQKSDVQYSFQQFPKDEKYRKGNASHFQKVERFDPNAYNQEQWVKFGFSPNQAKALMKYKKRIGGFKNLEDIQRAYVVNDFMYRKIQKGAYFNSSVFSSDSTNQNVGFSSNKENNDFEIMPIDVNLARSEDFKKFKGIGEVLSNRIIKYRDGLGGFYAIEQLSEVYGVQDSVYQQMKPKLILSNHQIKKLNINSASKDELKKHPYISWKTADKIVNYRMDWGKILDYNTIEKEKLIPIEQLEKLKPYLEF